VIRRKKKAIERAALLSVTAGTGTPSPWEEPARNRRWSFGARQKGAIVGAMSGRRRLPAAQGTHNRARRRTIIQRSWSEFSFGPSVDQPIGCPPAPTGGMGGVENRSCLAEISVSANT